MEANKAQAGPALPNLITAFRKGFDAVANHITLILLPLAMDLWIWLGLHLQIKGITNDVLQWITETAALDPNYQPGLLDANLEMLRAVQERLNVMIFLRTYPVGLPSLMAGRLPVESPLSATPFVDISSSGTVLVLWVLLSLVGLALGSLYFTLVAQAALDGALDLRKALSRWPGAALQSLFLALLVTAVLFAVSAPASCLLALLAQERGGGGADGPVHIPDCADVGDFPAAVFAARHLCLRRQHAGIAAQEHPPGAADLPNHLAAVPGGADGQRAAGYAVAGATRKLVADPGRVGWACVHYDRFAGNHFCVLP